MSTPSYTLIDTLHDTVTTGLSEQAGYRKASELLPSFGAAGYTLSESDPAPENAFYALFKGPSDPTDVHILALRPYRIDDQDWPLPEDTLPSDEPEDEDPFEPRAAVTYTTRKGKSVVSRLSTEEARAACLASSSSFAREMGGKPDPLRGDQEAWIHILAHEAIGGPAAGPSPSASAANLSGITALFDTASEHLQVPRLRFEHPSGKGQLVLYLSKKTSAHPETVQVTDGGGYGESTWYGRVERNGVFTRARACTDDVMLYLLRLNDDPQNFAAEYGRQTGRCCFCAQELTDPRSVEVGYGPICSQHYGLPWG